MHATFPVLVISGPIGSETISYSLEYPLNMHIKICLIGALRRRIYPNTTKFDVIMLPYYIFPPSFIVIALTIHEIGILAFLKISMYVRGYHYRGRSNFNKKLKIGRKAQNRLRTTNQESILQKKRFYPPPPQFMGEK